MTILDWVIAAALAFFCFRGFRRGLVQQIFGLVGIILALVLGFYLYQRCGAYLARSWHWSVPLANVAAFILLVVVISGLASFIGRRWHKTHEDRPVALFDGLLGAAFGGLKAALVWLIILLIAVTLPWPVVQTTVAESDLATGLLRMAPLFYIIQDHTLPSNLPRLVVSPEGLQLRPFKPSALAGATCFACEAKVAYRGLISQGLTVYPQTYCPKCRRTSDGCLTFEGFHMLRDQCPYQQFGTTGITDCKVWPNYRPATVHGKCPVCGRTQ